MPSGTAAMKKTKEVTCSICLQLVLEPVSIDCGHNFCHLCSANVLQKCPFSRMTLEKFCCPLCRAPFPKRSLQQNKQLENLIETIKATGLEKLCKEHGEQLQLFCVRDGQLICWRCERTSQHRGHITALVEDICQYYKEKLQKALANLRDLENQCKNVMLFTRLRMATWEDKIELQKQKIQSEFEKLHSFLHEEEKSYLWRLEKEKEQTLKRLQDNEAKLEKQSHELKNRILELEEKCQGSAQKLLQDVKDTLGRSATVSLELPEPVSMEPPPLCNVSELYFDVKKTLRHYQATVTLDPATARDRKVLSKVICRSEKLKFNTKSTVLCSVLGCESFTSGRHLFEVDVGKASWWDLGVCLENVQRDILVTMSPSTGFWAIRQYKEQNYVALTAPRASFPLREKPLIVGVFLDYEAGFVSFYNMTTGSHIFTFPKASFTKALRPYFRFYRGSPLLPLPSDE